MSMASRPHSDRRAEAWSRIDTTKTEDMVPSSELRGWLAEYVGLFEQYEELGRDLDGKAFLKDAAEAKIRRLEEQLEALEKKLYRAGDMCCRPPGTCIDAEWFSPMVAQASNPAKERLNLSDELGGF